MFVFAILRNICRSTTGIMFKYPSYICCRYRENLSVYCNYSYQLHCPLLKKCFLDGFLPKSPFLLIIHQHHLISKLHPLYNESFLLLYLTRTEPCFHHSSKPHQSLRVYDAVHLGSIQACLLQYFYLHQ